MQTSEMRPNGVFRSWRDRLMTLYYRHRRFLQLQARATMGRACLSCC